MLDAARIGCALLSYITLCSIYAGAVQLVNSLADYDGLLPESVGEQAGAVIVQWLD